VFQRKENLGMSTAQFDTGVTEFVEKLRAFIRARVPDDATADDLTQETLFKVYRSRASLRDDDRLEAWLYRIARRTLIDYYRKRRPSEELPTSLKGKSQDEVDAIRDAVLISTIRFMEELPDTYRVPLQLSELEGMTMVKVARRLGLSLTAVKSRIRRGRLMIKRRLQDCCHFEFDQHGKVIGWERRNPRCCD
jgi:RNA polymerase sigma-70 factor (ECF subfamily)